MFSRATWFWALLFVCSYGCTRNAPRHAPQAETSGQRSASQPHERFRKIYPYSVIPGGVETAAEFQARRDSDETLSLHYKDLGRSLQLTELQSDQRMYASYRVGDEIFWTRKPLLIHAGERVLSDGASAVRARCGNRLSATPRLPVRRFQPPVLGTDKFELVIVPLRTPPLLPAVVLPPSLPELPIPAKPAISQVGGPLLPPVTPTGPGPSGYPIPLPAPPEGTPPIEAPIPPPIPPVVTQPKGPEAVYAPEVSTWILLCAGLILMIGVARLRRRANGSSTA